MCVWYFEKCADASALAECTFAETLSFLKQKKQMEVGEANFFSKKDNENGRRMYSNVQMVVR